MKKRVLNKIKRLVKVTKSGRKQLKECIHDWNSVDEKGKEVFNQRLDSKLQILEKTSPKPQMEYTDARFTIERQYVSV